MLGWSVCGQVPADLVAALEEPDLQTFAGRGSDRPNGPRCYLADGRGVAWRVDAPAGWRVAIDAEFADQPVPEHVLSRSRLPDGATAEQAILGWTRAEVMAKLTDVPILLRVREHGLGVADLGEYEPIALRSMRLADHVVTVGAAGRPPMGVGE